MYYYSKSFSGPRTFPWGKPDFKVQWKWVTPVNPLSYPHSNSDVTHLVMLFLKAIGKIMLWNNITDLILGGIPDKSELVPCMHITIYVSLDYLGIKSHDNMCFKTAWGSKMVPCQLWLSAWFTFTRPKVYSHTRYQHLTLMNT